MALCSGDPEQRCGLGLVAHGVLQGGENGALFHVGQHIRRLQLRCMVDRSFQTVMPPGSSKPKWAAGGRAPSARMETIIAVIEQPAVVRQILDHLGLPTGAASLRAPPDLPVRGTQAGPPGGQAADQPREWSYEPLFDDPPSLIRLIRRSDSRGRGAALLRSASPSPRICLIPPDTPSRRCRHSGTPGATPILGAPDPPGL